MSILIREEPFLRVFPQPMALPLQELGTFPLSCRHHTLPILPQSVGGRASEKTHSSPMRLLQRPYGSGEPALTLWPSPPYSFRALTTPVTQTTFDHMELTC